ncbi:MAG: efflux RND transporter periplasmic adaptor subunit [Candidatus Acidiferrales bacterium]
MIRSQHNYGNSAAGARAISLGVLALCVCLGGCGNKSASGDAPPGAMRVKVQVARAVEIPNSNEYLAVLKSRHSADITPQVAGQITKIYVKSGDLVKTGTPLLQVDPLKQQATVGSLEAQRTAQEANVRFAKTQLDRAQKLFDQGVIARQDLDTAQNNYDTAVQQMNSLAEQVKEQEVELHYYQVVAPMDGIVGDIPVRVGDSVTTATELTTVDEPGALEAYIYVPVARAREVRLGLPVHLKDDSGNVLGETQVTFLSPEVDDTTQTVLVKAAVPNARIKLRIEQQVRAEVIWSTHSAPVVPVLAVSRINGQYFAFLAENESGGVVARQKLLKIGDTFGNDYEVLDGIHPGDHIIVTGTQFLADGVPVSEDVEDSPASSTGH